MRLFSQGQGFMPCQHFILWSVETWYYTALVSGLSKRRLWLGRANAQLRRCVFRDR